MEPHRPSSSPFGSTHDVAVQQVVAGHYRAIFECSTDGIAFATPSGHFIDVNEAYAALTGHTREELIGRHYTEITVTEDRVAEEAHLARMLVTGQPVEYDKEYRHKDGRRIPAHLNVFLVRDAAGRMLGRSSIAFNLTSVRQHEAEMVATIEALRQKSDELEHRTAQAEQAERVKSLFLSNVSHELRTPLNAILGFTELLYDGEVGSGPLEQRECLEYVLDAARHLLAQIDDLLAVTRYDAGQAALSASPTAVSQVVADVVRQLTPAIDRKQQVLSVEVDPSLGEVFTDFARLRHLVFHLLDNAVKFTEEGGRVVVRVRGDGDEWFHVEVEDSGIGISPEDQSRLFRAFDQVDSGLARRHPGLGLGLALCQRIAHVQGGEIGLRSPLADGRGSVFHARLPRRLKIETPRLPADRRPRVLLVNADDDRGHVLSSLREAGCEVELAEGGARALELCRRESFDAIYTVLNLPDMLGLELLHALKSEQPENSPPIIVLAQTESSPLGIHIQDVILKPVDRDRIARTVRDLRAE